MRELDEARRKRRRSTVSVVMVGAATVAIVIGIAATRFGGEGERAADAVKSPSALPAGATATLTMPGHRTLHFSGGTVECVMSEAGDGNQQVVRLFMPTELKPRPEKGSKDPFLLVEAVPGLKGTREMPLEDREFDQGPADLVVFSYDPRNRNEVSSFAETSSGLVEVIKAACDPVPTLVLSIRGTLGAELEDGESADVVAWIELPGDG